MVFFTSCSSHFARAVGRISATFSLIKKFPLAHRSRCLSRSLPTSLRRARRRRRQRPDGIFIIKKYYSWPEGWKGGEEEEEEVEEGGGGKKVAERGNKWRITSGTEVAELISKTGGVIAGILKASRMNSATTANIPFPPCTLSARLVCSSYKRATARVARNLK